MNTYVELAIFDFTVSYAFNANSPFIFRGLVLLFCFILLFILIQCVSMYAVVCGGGAHTRHSTCGDQKKPLVSDLTFHLVWDRASFSPLCDQASFPPAPRESPVSTSISLLKLWHHTHTCCCVRLCMGSEQIHSPLPTEHYHSPGKYLLKWYSLSGYFN